jgi:hypothetical protein
MGLEKSDDPPEGCMVAPFPPDPSDPTVDNASNEVSIASSKMATFTTDPTGGDKAMKKRQVVVANVQTAATAASSTTATFIADHTVDDASNEVSVGLSGGNDAMKKRQVAAANAQTAYSAAVPVDKIIIKNSTNEEIVVETSNAWICVACTCINL